MLLPLGWCVGPGFVRAASTAGVVLVLCSTLLAAQADGTSGKDYREKDLSKQDLRKKDLVGADFEGATLVFSDFTGMNLAGVSFKDANLTGAKFVEANLTGADLRGAVVNQVHFTRAIMDKVNASGLKHSGLNRLNIAGAKSFREADFRNSDLRGSFAMGDFRGANFCGARLVDIVYPNDRSDLRGALYDSRTRWPAGFDPVAAGAVLLEAEAPLGPTAAELPGNRRDPSKGGAAAAQPAALASSLVGEDLQGKSLVGMDLRMRRLRGGNLQDADLSRVDLTDTDLQGADFRNANLSSARLDKADLTGADLRGANLLRAGFSGAKLIEANLEGQRLYLAGAAAHFERPAGVSSYGLEGTVKLSNGALTLRGANLRNAQIFGSLEGVDLRKADLRGTDFTQARDLDKARLTGARYDAQTRWAFDPTGTGAERVQDALASAAVEVAEVVPLYWLLGRWNVNPAGADDEPGALNLNGNRTYTWTEPKSQTVAKGHWRKATDLELAGGKGECIILLAAERGLDWTVAKHRSVLGGEDEIRLSAGAESHLAMRRNALPSGENR